MVPGVSIEGLKKYVPDDSTGLLDEFQAVISKLKEKGF